MAKATENIPFLDQDVDPSDEIQDFRFLSHLASYDNTSTTLPRRGEKDFEPNSTLTQTNALESARQAMHSALSYPRLHIPKSHIIGTFDPGSGNTVVRKPKGTFTRTMGVAQRDRLLLLPEEALYLLERGSLDVRWPEDRRMRSEEDGEVPMSLQGAYAAMMGTDGLTMERFIVYTGLKRAGYAVVRAPTWSDDGIPPNYLRLMGSGPIEQGTSVLSLMSRLFNWLLTSSPKSCPSFGPLVAPGLYRNYSDIYRALTLIPFHEPSFAPSKSPNSPATPYRVTYHVWKSSTTYRKTSPPTPDYHIAVVDARTTSTPTLSELSELLETTPYAPPNTGGHMYGRLKHGWRNVLLATVDQGVVSYLRLSDAGFGKQKLYETKQPTGSKRSGPGRGGYGRGRGEHRGRRGKR